MAFFVAPEWDIDDAEKSEMAKAILEVGQHYTSVLEKFDGKTTAWLSLGQCFATIYLSRMYAIHERHKDERAKHAASRPPPPKPAPSMTPTPQHAAPPPGQPVVRVNGGLQPPKEAPDPPNLRRADIGGLGVSVEFPPDHPLFRKPN
jgi:hypothetical protein